LATLGRFLLALPPDEAAEGDPPLLESFVGCARVPPALQAVRLPSSAGRWEAVPRVWGDDYDDDDSDDGGDNGDNNGNGSGGGGSSGGGNVDRDGRRPLFGSAAGGGGAAVSASPEEPPLEHRHAAVELPVMVAYYLDKILAHCGAPALRALTNAYTVLSGLDGNTEALNCLVAGYPRLVAAAAAANGGDARAAKDELTPAMVGLIRTQLVRFIFGGGTMGQC
jgi:hypothetical protein